MVNPEILDAIAKGLRDDGYVIFPGAIDPDYCAEVGREIVAEYERLISLGWRFSRGGRWMGHLTLIEGARGRTLWTMIREGGYVEAAERHLGRALAVDSYTGNMNVPGSRMQVMHQDFPPGEDKIRFNILVTETTEGNGAMEIVPKSQGDRYNYNTLHTSGAANRSVRWTGKPGDLIIRHCTLWHRGTPNHTDVARPLIGVTTSMVAEPKEDPPCDDPIGFTVNQYYGPNHKLDTVLELREAFAGPLVHRRRLIKNRNRSAH